MVYSMFKNCNDYGFVPNLREISCSRFSVENLSSSQISNFLHVL